MPKPSPSNLGSRLQSAADKLNLSMAAVAAKVELSPSFLSRVVSGKRQLTPAQAAKLSAVLKLPLSSLLSAAQFKAAKALAQSLRGTK